MLWGQQITVYTDHKNLMQDALGLTSDRVYRWRLLLEEYGPTIVYIKGIHNTVADAISRLDYGPVPEDKSTDDFRPMLVSLHLKPGRKHITISRHTGIHEPGVCQSR